MLLELMCIGMKDQSIVLDVCRALPSSILLNVSSICFCTGNILLVTTIMFVVYHQWQHQTTCLCDFT